MVVNWGIPLFKSVLINFDFSFNSFNCDGKLLKYNGNLSSLSGNIFVSKEDFSRIVIDFYKSLYPLASNDRIKELYLLISDFISLAFPIQGDIQIDKNLVLNFWNSRLSDSEIENIISISKPQFIDKDNLPFEHYFADYLGKKEKSLHFDKLISKSKDLGTSFMLFMLTVCFRTILGGVYTAPFINNNNLSRFFPRYKGMSNKDLIKNLEFIHDEKIPFVYTNDLDSGKIVEYIFDKYDHSLIKEMWVNILYERIPEVVSPYEPKKFLGDLFDNLKDVVITKNWKKFIDDKTLGLEWVVCFNNSPELSVRYKRSFVKYFSNQEDYSVFLL
jgi:hypothetical protein